VVDGRRAGRSGLPGLDRPAGGGSGRGAGELEREAETEPSGAASRDDDRGHECWSQHDRERFPGREDALVFGRAV
jgi:hypothetical protein